MKKPKRKLSKKLAPPDDSYIQVIQIPKADELARPEPIPEKPSMFPSHCDVDGMMPLETMAETTEIFTNAFRTDKLYL